MEPNLLMWAKYSHYNGVRIKGVQILNPWDQENFPDVP